VHWIIIKNTYKEFVMKKLLLAAAASAVLSASAANADCTYLRADLGLAFLPKVTDDLFKGDLSSKSTVLANVGVGYKYGDAFRVELALAHLFDPKQSYKKDKHKFSTYGGTEVAGEHKLEVDRKFTATALLVNGYADVAANEWCGFFLGAGVGAARVLDEVTVAHVAPVPAHDVADATAVANAQIAPMVMAKSKSKAQYNLALRGTVGVSFALAEDITADVAYSYNHFGKTKELKLEQGTATRTVPSIAVRAHALTAGVRFGL
jgi:opacity protein-like surface antigen